MYSLQEKVRWFALCSRLFVMALSAVGNALLPDHDAGVFVAPRDPLDARKSVADDAVAVLLGGLVRWDAHYFLHIAEHGYTYENCLAFFPLYPLAVRCLSYLLHHLLGPVLSCHSIIVVAAVLLNLLAFNQSAVLLFRLGRTVLEDEALAYKAAILYCINPASVFFSAPYSETLFALCTFYGMLKCVETRGGEDFSLQCGLLFGLSAICRSNGLLNIGFVAYEKLLIFVQFLNEKLVRRYDIVRNNSVLVLPLVMFPFVLSLVSFILTTVLSLIPFIGFQIYAYGKFCTRHKHNLPKFITAYAKAKMFKLPGTTRNPVDHWCFSNIPLAYSYVQQHYWDVGFLRYYQWKQIPNFLLAFPIVGIIIFYSLKYLRANFKFWNSSIVKKKQTYVDEEKSVPGISKLGAGVFAFVVHVAFLTCFCVLCAHVQVTTRLVASASPVLYWFTACLFPNTTDTRPPDRLAVRNSISIAPQQVETVENLNSRWKVFVLSQKRLPTTASIVRMYFFVYLVVGTLLFSNFYPWT